MMPVEVEAARLMMVAVRMVISVVVVALLHQELLKHFLLISVSSRSMVRYHDRYKDPTLDVSHTLILYN